MTEFNPSDNYRSPLIGVTDDANFTPTALRVDPTTKRLKVDALIDLGVDILDLTANDALAVGIVDGDGNQITSFGGGTQYATNDAYADGNTGTLALAVRDDTLSTLTEADGDFSVLRVSSTGALHVTGGGGGTEYTEDVATPNPIVGTATMMERDDALSSVTPVEGDWIGLRGTAEGALWVQDFNSDAILADTDAMVTDLAAIEGLLTTIDADTGNLSTIETNTDFGTVTGGGTETGALRVTIANNSTGVLSIDDNGGSITIDGTVTANLSATDNAVLDQIELNQDSQTAILTTIDTDTGSIATTNSTIAGAVSGSEMQVDVVAALPAGTNNIGDVDVASIAAGTNAIGDVGIEPRTSGGLDIFRSIDIDESEEEIKATAGQLFSITAFNTTAAPLFLKFYNLTAANTTVGSSTPVLTFVVPANADSDGAGFVWNNDIGLTFGTAITVACTTAVADADTGTPGANACIINIGYK